MIEVLISIIVPVYNVEKYVGRCLDSILCQTYANIEVIVIDDGSTDNSGGICDDYARMDARIKVFHQPNRGLAAARNAGLLRSQGEFIGFVDSDDWISPDMYRSLYQSITIHNADIAACGMYLVIDEVVYTEKKMWTGKTELLTTGEAMSDLMTGGRIKTNSWDKLYRRSVVSAVPFPEGHVYEDLYVMPDVFLKCEKISYTDTPYYYYYWREGSICRSFSFANAKDMFDAAVFRNRRVEESYPELKKWAYKSQIVYNTYIYRDIARTVKRDPEVKVLFGRIRKDMEKYSFSYLLDIPVTRLPSAILLKYFPVGYSFYSVFEKGVSKLIVRSGFHMLKYHKV